MVDVAKLTVVVDADVGSAEAGLKRVRAETAGLGDQMKAGAGIGAAFGAGMLAVNAASSALSGAFKGLLSDGIGLNTSMENVSAQLNAMTKDGAQSARILADIRKEADSTPFAFEEMARATASLLPVSKQSGAALMDLVKQAEVLAAVHPEQGLAGAAFALREATGGDFTSIVERFDLPRQRLNELKAQGVPALKAISTAMGEMGLDATLVSNLAQAMTGRWSTFQDTIAGIRGRLTAGIFEGLKSGLMTLQKVFDDNAGTIGEFADSVGTKLGAFVADLIPKLMSLGQQVIPAVGAAFTTFRTVIDGVVNGGVAFHNLLESSFGPALANGIVRSLESIRSVIAGIGQVFSGDIGLGDLAGRFYGQFAEALRGFDVGAIGRDVADRIGSAISAGFEAIGLAGFGEEIAGFINDLPIEGALTGLRDAFAGVAAALGDLFNTGDLGLFADDIREAFNIDLTSAIEAFRSIRDAAGEMGSAVADAAPKVRDALLEIAAAAQQSGAAGAVDQITEKLRDLGAEQTAGAVSSAAAQFATAFGTIVTAGEGLITGLGNLIAKVGELIGTGESTTTWGQVIDAAMANLITALTSPIQAFNALVTISGAVEKAQRDAGAAVVKAWQDTTTNVGTALTAIQTAISAWATAATNTVNGWVTTVQQGFEDARRAIEQKIDEAGEAVKKFPKTVLDTLGGLVASVREQASNIGQALIDGIGGAIDRGVDGLRAKFIAFANSLPQWARDVLGIKSPSTVFEEIGRQIVEGLRLGIENGLGALTDAFSKMNGLFRLAGQELTGQIAALANHWEQELARHNWPQKARELTDAIRSYAGALVTELAGVGDKALPAIERIKEDLSNGLADAVARATQQAQQAITTASDQISTALANLGESRQLRARRQAFEAGQTGESRTRSAQREDAEAEYQYRKDLREAEAETVERLRGASTEEEKQRIREEAEARLREINARKADEDAERKRRRVLEEEDRAFAAKQAQERQKFEDGLADESLAKQIKRIETERDARIAAVQAELDARRAALVATAQTALQRVVEDVNSKINALIGKYFDNFSDEIRKRGGPTDPGFLGAVRNELAGAVVPMAGALQSFLANLAGIGNTYGPGVSIPNPTTRIPVTIPTSRVPTPPPPPVWGNAPWLPGGYGIIPPGEQGPGAMARDINVVLPQGAYYGSLADLARVLGPELDRLVSART